MTLKYATLATNHSISSFHAWALTAPLRTFTLSKNLCYHVWSNMDKGMPVGNMRERLRTFQCIPVPILLLSGQSRGACSWSPWCHPHRIERETVFQFNPRIDGAIGKASKPIKGYPFKGTNEQSGHDSIIIYHIIGLWPKVIDALVWRACRHTCAA